jgi:hypothetical protein
MNISTKFGSKWPNGFRGEKKKTDNPICDTFVPLRKKERKNDNHNNNI